MARLYLEGTGLSSIKNKQLLKNRKKAKCKLRKIQTITYHNVMAEENRDPLSRSCLFMGHVE